jgi:hypothetical protein
VIAGSAENASTASIWLSGIGARHSTNDVNGLPSEIQRRSRSRIALGITETNQRDEQQQISTPQNTRNRLLNMARRGRDATPRRKKHRQRSTMQCVTERSSSSLARYAVRLSEYTDITSTTTSRSKSDGYAQNTTQSFTDNSEAVLDKVWYWNVKLPERKGQRCRILARGRMNSIMVEFEDGKRYIVSRRAVRDAS